MSRLKQFPPELSIGITGKGEFVIMPQIVKSEYFAINDIRKVGLYLVDDSSTIEYISDKAKTQKTLKKEKTKEPVMAGLEAETLETKSSPVSATSQALKNEEYPFVCYDCGEAYTEEQRNEAEGWCVCGGKIVKKRHKRTKAEIEASKEAATNAEKAPDASMASQTPADPTQTATQHENAKGEATEALYRCLNPGCKSKGNPLIKPKIFKIGPKLSFQCPFCLKWDVVPYEE